MGWRTSDSWASLQREWQTGVVKRKWALKNDSLFFESAARDCQCPSKGVKNQPSLLTPNCPFQFNPISSHSNLFPAPALDKETEEYKREEIRCLFFFPQLLLFILSSLEYKICSIFLFMGTSQDSKFKTPKVLASKHSKI